MREDKQNVSCTINLYNPLLSRFSETTPLQFEIQEQWGSRYNITATDDQTGITHTVRLSEKKNWSEDIPLPETTDDILYDHIIASWSYNSLLIDIPLYCNM